MLRYMLDTDLCIRVLRDRPKGLREHFNAESDGLCISSITLYELPSERSGRQDRSQTAMRWSISPPASERWSLVRKLRHMPDRSGQIWRRPEILSDHMIC